MNINDHFWACSSLFWAFLWAASCSAGQNRWGTTVFCFSTNGFAPKTRGLQRDCRGRISARFREYSTSAVPPGTAIVTVKISPLCKAMGKKESQPITMDLSNYPPPFAALLQCMLTALFLTNCCSLSQTAVSL